VEAERVIFGMDFVMGAPCKGGSATELSVTGALDYSRPTIKAHVGTAERDCESKSRIYCGIQLWRYQAKAIAVAAIEAKMAGGTNHSEKLFIDLSIRKAGRENRPTTSS